MAAIRGTQAGSCGSGRRPSRFRDCRHPEALMKSCTPEIAGRRQNDARVLPPAIRPSHGARRCRNGRTGRGTPGASDPSGPARCLATMTSAAPRSGDSLLYTSSRYRKITTSASCSSEFSRVIPLATKLWVSATVASKTCCSPSAEISTTRSQWTSLVANMPKNWSSRRGASCLSRQRGRGARCRR